MVLAPNQKECVDVNECLEDNGGCEQVLGQARGYGRITWNDRYQALFFNVLGVMFSS